jgi:hypothetical protein
MFSIEATYDMKDVGAYMEKRMQERINEIVEFLRAKGVEYTTIAREKVLAKPNKIYTNRTHNLVSSVGFAIVSQGKVMESYFPLSGTGVDGKTKGEATAEKSAKEFAGVDDISLVLVAAESYARYVEAKEFDVVTGSSDRFEAGLLQQWGAYR